MALPAIPAQAFSPTVQAELVEARAQGFDKLSPNECKLRIFAGMTKLRYVPNQDFYIEKPYNTHASSYQF